MANQKTSERNEWTEGRTVTMKVHFSQELLQQMAYLKKQMQFEKTGRQQHAKPSDMTAEDLKMVVANELVTLGGYRYGEHLGCDVGSVTNDPNVSVEVQIEDVGYCEVEGAEVLGY